MVIRVIYENISPISEVSNFKLSGPSKRYKVLYEFDARNHDELTLRPDDIVNVFDDQTGAEPGWKGGEMNGNKGWFPEAYVELMAEEPQSTAINWGSAASAGAGEAFPSSMVTSEASSFMAVHAKVPSVTPSPTPGQVRHLLSILMLCEGLKISPVFWLKSL